MRRIWSCPAAVPGKANSDRVLSPCPRAQGSLFLAPSNVCSDRCIPTRCVAHKPAAVVSFHTPRPHPWRHPRPFPGPLPLVTATSTRGCTTTKTGSARHACCTSNCTAAQRNCAPFKVTTAGHRTTCKHVRTRRASESYSDGQPQRQPHRSGRIMTRTKRADAQLRDRWTPILLVQTLQPLRPFHVRRHCAPASSRWRKQRKWQDFAILRGLDGAAKVARRFATDAPIQQQDQAAMAGFEAGVESLCRRAYDSTTAACGS